MKFLPHGREMTYGHMANQSAPGLDYTLGKVYLASRIPKPAFLLHRSPPPPKKKDGYTGVSSSGHHRTPSGGIQTSLAGGVGAGYLGMGMSGMGGIHAAQAYGMATPRLMQAGEIL